MASEEFNPGKIRLVLGLGNPGAEYGNTYHNAGFRALAAAASGADFRRPAGKSFSFARRKERLFVRPETFMNESGAALREALRYFGPPRVIPGAMLVVHDDSDLPLGTWKLQFGRGAAGHRGVASIIAALGTKGFWRARIGIRPAPRGERREKAEAFVLKRMTRADARALESVSLAFGEALADGTS